MCVLIVWMYIKKYIFLIIFINDFLTCFSRVTRIRVFWICVTPPTGVILIFHITLFQKNKYNICIYKISTLVIQILPLETEHFLYSFIWIWTGTQKIFICSSNAIRKINAHGRYFLFQTKNWSTAMSLDLFYCALL